MSATKNLPQLLKKLLDGGIVIDDGREKVLISSASSYRRVSGIDRSRVFTLQLGRPTRPPRKAPARHEEPPPSVSRQDLIDIIAHYRKGIGPASLSKLTGLDETPLQRMLDGLHSKGKLVETDGFYYPGAGGNRRRIKGLVKTCTIPACGNEHYANGLCNNHYNVARREAIRHSAPAPRSSEFDSFRDRIIDVLRQEGQKLSLHELAKRFNQKWQTIRKDIQALIRGGLLAKDGKKYFLTSEARF